MWYLLPYVGKNRQSNKIPTFYIWETAWKAISTSVNYNSLQHSDPSWMHFSFPFLFLPPVLFLSQTPFSPGYSTFHFELFSYFKFSSSIHFWFPLLAMLSLLPAPPNSPAPALKMEAMESCSCVWDSWTRRGQVKCSWLVAWIHPH